MKNSDMTEVKENEYSNPPLFGALSGVSLSVDQSEILPGLVLRQSFTDMFSAPMLAFGPPQAPDRHHPDPWEAVRGGFSYKSRIEAGLLDNKRLNGVLPVSAMWLLAALLRLQVRAPVRMAVLSKSCFDAESAESGDMSPVAFEASPDQLGLFSNEMWSVLSEEDLDWLQTFMPVILRLHGEERFFRSFSIYEQAQWSRTIEAASVLICSAIEALFDLGKERDKTKAISRALSEYVGEDRSDRDRAYQVISDLYRERSRVVHAGRSIEAKDFAQLFQLAKVAFRRVIIDGDLPPARK